MRANRYRGRQVVGRRRARRPHRHPRRSVTARAESSLRGFRQSTLVAVAATALLLLALDPGATAGSQDPLSPSAAVDSASAAAPRLTDEPPREKVAPDSMARESAAAASGALRDIWNNFLGNLPKYLVALGVLLLAWGLVRVLHRVLRRVLKRWERADATAALVGVVIWLLAAGIALSVLVGDIRALAGSLGLVGLALSWALQTPIESFTGWLLNSFKGYYRTGDRIAVGDVFGDVYRIDILNTTVWEYGGVDRPPGWVHAEQPTGRLITFPNSEVLNGSVVNYTRDFPFVWDELEVAVAAESDVRYALDVFRGVAVALLGDYMSEPARRYGVLLGREGLEPTIAVEPQVYASLTDWGVNLTVRYLVGAREKRVWKSDLVVRILEELNREDHAGRILPVYPRQQVQLVGPDGAVREPPVV